MHIIKVKTIPLFYHLRPVNGDDYNKVKQLKKWNYHELLLRC